MKINESVRIPDSGTKRKHFTGTVIIALQAKMYIYIMPSVVLLLDDRARCPSSYAYHFISVYVCVHVNNIREERIWIIISHNVRFVGMR